MVRAFKIIAVMVMVMTMAMGAFSLMGCGNVGLKDYKISGKAKIDAYFSTKAELDYSTDNWTALCLAVEEGKTKVNKASTKDKIDKAVEDAIVTIKNILPDWMDGIIIERWDQDWNSNQWDNKTEVSITFPREVRQGESFSITIVTTNISDVDFDFITCSCCKNNGVKVNGILPQSNAEFELLYSPLVHHSDGVKATIPSGQSSEFTWTVYSQHHLHDGSQTILVDAPIGVYDIYLENGEVFRNAINIV